MVLWKPCKDPVEWNASHIFVLKICLIFPIISSITVTRHKSQYSSTGGHVLFIEEIDNAVLAPGHIYGNRIEGLCGEKWIWEEVNETGIAR